MWRRLENLKRSTVRELKQCDLIIHSQHDCLRNVVSTKENFFCFDFSEEMKRILVD